MNSRKYWRKRGTTLMTEEEREANDGENIPDLERQIDEKLHHGETLADVEAEYEYVEEERDGHSEYYHTDEEPEDQEGQKEDMKIYLSKLNAKIDVFVSSL
jgi:hypothetical protein